MGFLRNRVRSFAWLGLPVIAAAGLFFGLRDGAAAWKAHQGEGVPGTFVATSAMCELTGDSCSTVYGTFTSADGRAVRKDVVLYEAPKSVQDGGKTAALDSGAPHGVFLADGGSSYVMYTVFTAGGALAALLWVLFLVNRFRRGRTRSLAQPA